MSFFHRHELGEAAKIPTRQLQPWEGGNNEISLEKNVTPPEEDLSEMVDVLDEEVEEIDEITADLIRNHPNNRK